MENEEGKTPGFNFLPVLKSISSSPRPPGKGIRFEVGKRETKTDEGEVSGKG